MIFPRLLFLGEAFYDEDKCENDYQITLKKKIDKLVK